MDEIESTPGNAQLRSAVVLLPVGLIALVIGVAGGAFEQPEDASFGEIAAICFFLGAIVGLIGLVHLVQGLRARLQ